MKPVGPRLSTGFTGHTVTGFTLVETLIALTLGLWLITGVLLTVQQLWKVAGLSADQSELAERGDFAVRVLSTAVTKAWPVRHHDDDVASPCGDPSTKHGRGVRLVFPGQFPCLPQHNLVPGSPILVVEGLHLCEDTLCKHQRLPGWRLERPGCDPLFVDVPPRLQHHSRVLADSDCAGPTTLSAWSRQFYYLRDYTWQPGDGGGALMRASWRSASGDGGVGRAEVLVPGVVRWDLSVIELGSASRTAAEGVQEGSVEGGLRLWRPGIDFGLTLRGHRADNLASRSLRSRTSGSRPELGATSVPEGVPTLSLTGRAVSQFLTVDQFENLTEQAVHAWQ